MEALREIVRTTKSIYNLKLPEWAVGRDVEIIVLPLGSADETLGDNKRSLQENIGPLSVLGYAKTFRQTKTTEEWMCELREGDVL